MDFSHNEEPARAGRASAGTILTDKATPRAAGARWRPAGDRFDPALWADLAEAGDAGGRAARGAGGAGLGLLEQCSVLDEIGRAVAPVPYLASIVLGAGA